MAYGIFATRTGEHVTDKVTGRIAFEYPTRESAQSVIDSHNFMNPLHVREFSVYRAGIRTGEVDGKRIAWGESTEFLVQVGRGSRGSYRTRFAVTGDLTQACFLYRCINIGNGYKKRLLMPACSKNPVIAKASS